MGPWTVHSPPTPAARPSPGQALALEVDPRRKTVSLAWVTVGLGSAEVGNLAVFRCVFAGEAFTLEPARTWLSSSPAAALLATVTGGYAAETLWSGDTLGRWTPEAWSAAEALADGVGERLHAP